jgi:DNA-binding XRE family transcriptional regulator
MTPTTMGEKIVSLRNQCRLTRRQLASKLGLTLRQMKAVETDTKPVP